MNWYLLIALSLPAFRLIFGSCWIKSENRLTCCQGKNHTCHGFDKIGSKWAGRQIKCFCDEHCVKSKDCCSDYKRLCSTKAINCILSNWGQWSPCSVDCGAGVQTRFRKVIIPQQHNGRTCDHTEQARFCHNNSCSILRRVAKVKTKRHSKSKRRPKKLRTEIHLIPKLERNIDTRKLISNRFGRNGKIYMADLSSKNNADPKRNVYCATYQITNSTSSCKVWKDLSKLEQIYWKSHSERLNNGQRVCLTCSSHSDNNYKCFEGNKLNNLNKWTAVRSDNCYGQFRMIETPKTCHCPNGSLSYHVV